MQPLALATQHDAKTLAAILEAARLAVSADNGQPWRFHWRDSRLQVLLDQSCVPTFFDHGRFASWLGIGSVLENIAIASARFGYRADVELLPGGKVDGHTVAATVRFTATGQSAHPLFAAIEQRHTNRTFFDPTAVPAEARTALERSGDAQAGFRIILIDARETIAELARLTALAERIRFDFTDREAHRDFFSCLRYSRAQAETTKDGLWLDTLEIGAVGKLALRLLAKSTPAAVASRVGLKRVFSAQSAQLLRNAPLIAVVAQERRPGHAPEPGDFIAGGRFCQRLWLTATSFGLSAQPMAIFPIFSAQSELLGKERFPLGAGDDVAGIIARAESAIGLRKSERMHLLFRFGYARRPAARSFRRPLSELFQAADDSPLCRDAL